MIKIGPVTDEILLIWTKVARSNVAWTNVTKTVMKPILSRRGKI